MDHPRINEGIKGEAEAAASRVIALGGVKSPEGIQELRRWWERIKADRSQRREGMLWLSLSLAKACPEHQAQSEGRMTLAFGEKKKIYEAIHPKGADDAALKESREALDAISMGWVFAQGPEHRRFWLDQMPMASAIDQARRKELSASRARARRSIAR